MTYVWWSEENVPPVGTRIIVLLVCAFILLFIVNFDKSYKMAGISSSGRDSSYSMYYNDVYCCSVNIYYTSGVTGSKVKCLPLQLIFSSIGYSISVNESSGTIQLVSSSGAMYILLESKRQAYLSDGMWLVPIDILIDIFSFSVDVDNKYNNIFISSEA